MILPMKQFHVLNRQLLALPAYFGVRPWAHMLHFCMLSLVGLHLLHTTSIGGETESNNEDQETEIFRPRPGEFPPLEKAHAYRGEIVFIDHPNRRGSIRVEGTGKFYRNDPQPFAMLPYGVIRYQGAPADLRDIPLGTVMRVRAFLPPDPKVSVVPVLPVDNKDRDVGHYRGTGTAPAENHVLLLEDELSYCLREGMVWRLQEIEINKDNTGKIIASLESSVGGDSDFKEEEEDEELTFDAATRIWRGRERIRVADLIADKVWPESGQQELRDQAVQLAFTWKPGPGDGLAGVFTRFHISDIWLDDEAVRYAAQFQTETHKTLIRTRWMPAWVDTVEYGKFGQATVTATLFGGMDSSLYEDFREGIGAQMNGAENTLKHTAGHYGPSHMAANGKILKINHGSGKIPLGSSGIQIQFETDLIIEAIRPGRIVRIRPESWPKMQIPREEYLFNSSFEDRFPNPDIFPKY